MRSRGFAPLRPPATIPTSAPMGYESVKAVPQIRRSWITCCVPHGTFPERSKIFSTISSPGEKIQAHRSPKIENCRVQVGWRPPYIKMEILSQKRSCSFLLFIAFYLPKRNFLRTRAASALYSLHDARDFRRMGDNGHLDLRRWTHWCTSLCFPGSNEGVECRT